MKHANPRRHAGDIAFHLDNAVGACNRVIATAKDRRTHRAAELVRDQVLELRQHAQTVKRIAGKAQARP